MTQHRGYINVGKLTDFWIHMGTQCNLHCPSCFEKAHTHSRRLESFQKTEAQELVLEALELGVQKICFTGGEPFIHPNFIHILAMALNYRPCLVLSNATDPMERHLPELAQLSDKKHKLHVRVSIDYPTEHEHDAGRGKGTFQQSLQNCARLANMGHILSIARRKMHDEKDSYDETRINAAYQQLFRNYNIPINTHIVAFPDLALCAHTQKPEITEHCMTTYKTAEERQNFMCAHCLMVTKQKGKICFYPCTLVDDDENYILGHTLAQARQKNKIFLNHQRCFTCFAHGTSCVES